VNNFEVKEAKIWYNNDIIICEINRAMMKHIQTLNRVLVDLKRAECTVSEIKSQFCCAEIKIIDFVCVMNDRHSNITKVIKILNWLVCTDLVETREFIEICVYYRIWIDDFVIIVASIYILFKKNVVFIWEVAQQKAMNILKLVFTSFFALISLNYESKKNIILDVNASDKN
jgi:hypothetical protein